MNQLTPEEIARRYAPTKTERDKNFEYYQRAIRNWLERPGADKHVIWLCKQLYYWGNLRETSSKGISKQPDQDVA